ncbi:hypothetical protein [Okeania sp.]|uniref:hypothetical protein n=1 Tax=Okeania sp. TaxID=3100323 RepID=UPI002B4B3CC0|nr:hypothetical protein [Okeania sp.]MEB3342138.1 hypothetical protein [Okeania sp.]
MYSQDFQTIAERINDTGNKLLQYLQELEAGISRSGEYNQELQKIGNNIKEALNALQEERYQVAVVAAMKAGKSTF